MRNDSDDFHTGIPSVSKENIVYKVSKFNNQRNHFHLLVYIEETDGIMRKLKTVLRFSMIH